MPRVDPAIRRLREDRVLPVIAETLKIARQAPYAWKRVPRCGPYYWSQAA